MAYNFRDFHSKSKTEKRNEVSKRLTQSKERMLLNNDIHNDLLHIKRIKDLNQKYAYKQFELYGKFDHEKTLYINTVQEGVVGFNILTPFIYQPNSESLDERTIFVDRGFIQFELLDGKRNLLDHNSTGFITVKGFIAFPHKTKHSEENEIKYVDVTTIDLNEFCDYHLINDDLARKAYIKKIDFNNESQGLFPISDNLDMLNTFNTSICLHSKLQKFFSGLAFLGVFSNMAMWIAF